MYDFQTRNVANPDPGHPIKDQVEEYGQYKEVLKQNDNELDNSGQKC